MSIFAKGLPVNTATPVFRISIALACATFCLCLPAHSRAGEPGSHKPLLIAMPFAHVDDYYSVNSEISRENAQSVSDFLKKSESLYRLAFSLPEAKLSRLPVYVFGNTSRYESLAHTYGLPDGTAGLFVPEENILCLPYVTISNVTPEMTLLHEGTHRFIRETLDFRVPENCRQLFPPERQILASVPLWLNEGMATYLEAAIGGGGELREGLVNENRLRHLRKIIRKKYFPPLSEVLALPYGSALLPEHYAVSWGLVQTLRHNRDTALEAENRKKLAEYFSLCARGFFNNPDSDFQREFLSAGKLKPDFEQLWRARIADCSRKYFEQLFLSHGEKLEQWQEKWIRRVFQIR